MSAPAPPPPSAPWLRQHGAKLVLSLIVAGGCVWLMRAGALPLVPPMETLGKVAWWTVAASFVIWSFAHVVRAVRWSFLLAPLHPIPLRRVMAVGFVGFAAIVLLPFRTGEAVRPVMIRKKGELSGWAATGTVGAERVIDGLFLSVMLFLALQLTRPLSPLPERIGDLPIPASVVPRAAYAALALFGVAFAMMGLFYWRRRWARNATQRIVGAFSPRAADWLSERVESVAEGLRFLPEVRYSAPFVVATAIYWFANVAGTWLLCRGCGLTEYSFGQSCVTIGVLALGILVPNAPGFFGAYQLALYASFAMYYPPADVIGPGSAYVFLAYLLQIGITVVAGVWGMVAERAGVDDALGQN